MAFDENLAARIRDRIADRSDVTERRMFGGLAFLVRGHMCCGVVAEDLVARVGPDSYERLLAEPHARPMDFTGRPLASMVYVSPAGVRTARALAAWIERSLRFVETLPPKEQRGTNWPKGSSVSSVPSFSGFPEQTFRFLRGVTLHNEKAWFEAHRGEYEAGYVEPAKAFVNALGPRLRKISPSVQFEPKVNGSLFRINRDVRFAKDKTPYKNHIDLWFWHGKHRGWDTPGFFFRMFADRVILGAGMHRFEKGHLERYRQAVVASASGRALGKVIDDVRSSGEYVIGGATRKTVPRGFDAIHVRAPLLLHEGLWGESNTSLGDVGRTSAFVDFCADHIANVWPIARWLLKNVASSTP